LIAVNSSGKEELPLFEKRLSPNNQPRAFICLNSVCNLPAETIDEFNKQLGKL
jgi:uncharacterized protein YyaL (SSP411 family)